MLPCHLPTNIILNYFVGLKNTVVNKTRQNLVIILDDILPANPVAERIITGGSLLLVYGKYVVEVERENLKQ